MIIYQIVVIFHDFINQYPTFSRNVTLSLILGHESCSTSTYLELKSRFTFNYNNLSAVSRHLNVPNMNRTEWNESTTITIISNNNNCWFWKVVINTAMKPAWVPQNQNVELITFVITYKLYNDFATAASLQWSGS